MWAYIQAWRRHDVAGVLATLTDDCVVVESYGPVYRGHDRVEQWMRRWFAEGGSVTDWNIVSETVTGDVLVMEWVFSCIWQSEAHTFERATIARLRGERIARLREYATTAPLYEWTGEWRT
ncbi:nuclear transport factor 2 family protein [Streptomyces sp. YIM S03343]